MLCHSFHLSDKKVKYVVLLKHTDVRVNLGSLVVLRHRDYFLGQFECCTLCRFVSLGGSCWEGTLSSQKPFLFRTCCRFVSHGNWLGAGIWLRWLKEKGKGVQYSEATFASMKKSLGHCKLRVVSFIFLFIMQSIIYMLRSIFFSFFLLPFSVVLYLRCITSLWNFLKVVSFSPKQALPLVLPRV